MVSNVDAKAHSDPEVIRDILARQVSVRPNEPANPAGQFDIVACLPGFFLRITLYHHLHNSGIWALLLRSHVAFDPFTYTSAAVCS